MIQKLATIGELIIGALMIVGSYMLADFLGYPILEWIGFSQF